MKKILDLLNKKSRKFFKISYLLFNLFFLLNLSFSFLASPQLVDAATKTNKTTDKVAGDSDIFGSINAPAGVAELNAKTGEENGIGVVIFLANVIRLITVVAGIWTMFNFVMAGWGYLTTEGSKAHEQATSKMINSAIGLIIIAASYTIAGLIGLLIFGDAKFILEPTFQGIN